MILADSEKVAEAIIETLQSAKQNVLLQKFVAESKGKDIRAFVVGGRVVAAMRRVAAGNEFRSNVHRGGSTEAVTLSPEFETCARQGRPDHGLAGRGRRHARGRRRPAGDGGELQPGPRRHRGRDEGRHRRRDDRARRGARRAARHRRPPAAHAQERYGVADVIAGEGFTHIGQTIAEANFREREVLVLSITRGSVVIPAPKGDVPVLEGDKLLCYGKLLTIKTLGDVRSGKGESREVGKLGSEEVSTASPAATVSLLLTSQLPHFPTSQLAPCRRGSVPP